MKIVEVRSNIQQGRILCESICKDLTKQQRIVVEGIYKDLEPLMEMELTTQQITQLFKDLEQTNSGERTMIGKGVDAAKYVNDTINKVGRWLQDTAPVKAFDQKYQSLITDISNKLGADSKVVSYTKQLGQFAKNNPGTTAAIIGVLTTVAAIAGGPAGGAIAGQVLRGTAELLKGSKLSTAVGKGAKTAAIGYGVGKIADMIKDFMPSASEPASAVASASDATPLIRGGLWDGMSEEMRNEILQKYPGTEWTFKNDGFNLWVYDAQGGKEAMISYDAMLDHLRQQGHKFKESVVLTVPQVNQLFEHLEISEGLWDKFKTAVGQKVSNVGKNLTQKFTAQKFADAWKKAGEPTDSLELAKFLQSLGVSTDTIIPAFKAIGVDLAVKEPESKLPDIEKLTHKQKQELLRQLEQA